MKVQAMIFVFISGFFALLSGCQKNIDYTESAGSLLDSAGNCRSIIINGTYQVDSVLGNQNYLLVGVNVTAPGTYAVYSDTLNGYFFRAIGTFNDPGVYSLRLNSAGRPLLPGLNTFTVQYGQSSCQTSITVQ